MLRSYRTQTNWRRLLLQLILLVICCGATGLVAISMGKDVDGDLLNYHYYNVYALIHGRIGWDIAPAQLQTYINPIFDFPFYFLLTHVSNPWLVTFGMGALQGITAYLLVLVVLAFLREESSIRRIIYSGPAIAVGLTGAAGLPVLGTTMVAWIPAGFMLAGLLLLLKTEYAKTERFVSVLYVISGLLLGFSVGGKLTMGPYAIGLAVAIFLYRGITYVQVRRVAIYSVGVLIGVVAIHGYWSVLLYKHFQSPIFPFFNDIFKSPYWEIARIGDSRFKPRNLYQWIFYPMYWSHPNHLVTELIFRDLRFSVIYAGLAIALLYRVLNKINGGSSVSPSLKPQYRLLLIFFVVSYIIWEKLFSIYRYIFPLELLSGIALFILIEQVIVKNPWKTLTLIAISGVILGTTIYPNWGRAGFGDKYFPTKITPLPKKFLLVIAGTAPMAYIIPMLGPNVRAVSIDNNFLKPRQHNLLVDEANHLVRSYSGPMFSVSPIRLNNSVDSVYKIYGLRRDINRCQNISPKIGDDTLVICPVRHIVASNAAVIPNRQ